MGGIVKCLPGWTWALCLSGALQPAEAHIHAGWDGSTGSWTDATRWSTDPEYPRNGGPNAGDTYAVSITGGNVTRNTPVTVSTLSLSGGGVISGASTLTVLGATTWSGGAVQAGNLVCNGGLSITSGAWLSGGTAELTLAGGQTASITGNGIMNLENQSTVINNGMFYVRNDSGISESGTGQGRFTNNDTFTRDTSAGTVTIGVSQFGNTGNLNVNTGTLDFLHGITNSGAIQIAAGATLKLSNASIFNPGSSFSGSGRLLVGNDEQHLHLSLAIPNSVTLATAGKISIYDGHTLTLNGALTWAGGTLARESNFFGGDHGFVELNGGASISNGANFYGLTLTNTAASSVVLGNGARLWFGGDAIFQNAGNFTLQGVNAGLEFTSDTTGNVFNNSGVFTSNADPLNAATIRVGFINSGTVNAASGVTTIQKGGSSTGTFQAAEGAYLRWWGGDYVFHAGTAFTGTGTFAFDGGTQTFDASLSTASTLDFASSLTLPSGVALSNNGALHFSGGLSGGGTLLANGSLGLSGGAIDGSTVENSATATATHRSLFTGLLYTLTNGGVIHNSGTFLARDATGFNNGSGAGNTFVNAGTFTRDSGSNAYHIGTLFDNTGNVTVNTGTLILSGGGTSTGGVFQVTDPAKLVFSADYTFQGGNAFTGTGLVVFGTEAADQPVATHTIAADMTVGNLLTLGNSTVSIAPGASLTAGGACNALLGTITGGGTLHATGGSNIGQVTVDGAILRLGSGADNIHASGFEITLTNTGVLDNSGVFLAQGDHGISVGAGAGNVVNNSGVLNRTTSSGVYTIAAPINNTGTVSSQSGTLLLAGGGTAIDGTFDATGGLLQFAGDFVFNGTTSFTGTGTADFVSGTSTVNGPLAAACPIVLEGGSLAVQAGQTITSGGPLTFGAVAAANLTGGGTYLANGGITLDAGTVDGATLANAAAQTASHNSAYSLVLKNGGIFANAGTFLAQSDASITEEASLLSNIFHNFGSFTRNTSAGTYVVDVPFENSGVVNTETGTLRFLKPVTATGSFHTEAGAILNFTANNTFDSATLFTGGGNVQLQSGSQSLVQSAVSDGVISLSSGEVVLPPGVALISNGSFHWDGGLVSGGGTLQNAGELVIIAGPLPLDGATLHTSATGTSSIAGAGMLVLSNGAVLNNEGTLALLSNNAIAAGDASAVRFDNSGTVNRDYQTETFFINVPFNHSGTLNLNTGALSFNGGGTAHDSSIHTQPGTALNIGTSYTFGANNVITGSGAVNFSNGVLHVTGSLTSDASFNWSGGTLDGGGTFTVKGGLAITPGPANVYIIGSTLENAAGSEAVIGGSGYSMLQDGGTFRNAGTARLQGDYGFLDNGGSGNAIDNTGTLIRDAGSGSYSITLPIHNTGTIRSSSGSLRINNGGSSGSVSGVLDATGGDIYLNGGTYEFSGGAVTGTNSVYLSAGEVMVTGDTGATSGPASGGFGIAGGTFGGSAMLSVDHGYLSTGTMTGTAVLRFTGESSKPNYTLLNMSGGTIRNDGVFNQSYQANYDLDVDIAVGGGTIENHGDWNLTNSSIFYNSQGGGTINNAGNFNQAAGGNYIYAAFNNLAGGTLNATSGNIMLQGGGSQQMGGTLNANGGSIYLNGGTHTLNGGSLAGADFTYVAAGTVNIAANVGASSGPATGGLGISGGTLGGSAMIAADHGYFSTGSITGTVVVRLAGASSKANYTLLTMTGGTIRNDGSYTQSYQADHDLDAGAEAGGGTIQNNGDWSLYNSSTVYNSNGEGVINNAGNFNQSAGGNSIYAAFHNQATGVVTATSGAVYLRGGGSQAAGGTLNADGGSIYFLGGTHELNGGSLAGSTFSYVSSGLVNVNQNVGAASGSATGGIGVSGGTLGGTAMISADHGYFSTGSIAGTVVVRLTGASDKASYTMLNMTGGTIRNDGSYTQSYQADYDLDADPEAGGGTIQNNGDWSLYNSSTVYNSNGEGVINNAGNFNQLGGGNSIYAAFHNQATGVVTATSGAVYLRGGGSQAAGGTLNADGGSIYFLGGTHELNGGTLAGSTFSYVSSGLVNINQNVGAASGSATGGIGVSGGTLGGTAMISADHGYFSSGSITGTVVVRLTGSSDKANYTTLGMSGGTIQNDGTFNQNYQGNFDMDTDPEAGGGTIHNNGSWNLTNSSTFGNSYGGGVINNAGNFNQAAGGNYVYAEFHNQATGVVTATSGAIYLSGGGSQAAGGTLNADGGSIYFQGGTHELNGGSLAGGTFSYVSTGLVNINRNVGAASGSATGGIGVSGGTLGGTAMISADHGSFSSGLITGSVVVRLTGASDKANYSTLGMSGGTIQNDGSFNQNYQGHFDMDTDPGAGGGTIRNNGTWNMTNSSVFFNSYGEGVIINTGDFNQWGGTNYIQAFVDNSGTFIANGGTVYLQGDSVHSGALVTNSGIVLAAGTHSMAGPSAYLGGIGELYGNLTISDGASISPGYSVGTLTLSGEVRFVTGGSTPACSVELAGPGASDQINIANGATLDLGSNLTDLRISLLAAPAFGNSFRIVNAGGSGRYTGSFRNLPSSGAIISVAYAGQPYSLQIAYSGDGRYVDLTVLSPYQAWAYGKGLVGADAGFGADPDDDGIANGIEFVIGGEPNPASPGSDSRYLLPQISVEAAGLRVVYRRNHDALYLVPGIDYDADLAGTWTRARQDENGVTINVANDGFGPNIDRVEVLIPRSNEIAGKLFARLTASEP